MWLWDVVETNHNDNNECFHWNLQEMSQGLTVGTSWIRTTERSGWRTNEPSLGVSFGTCVRCREDVPMKRHCYNLGSCHDVLIRCCGDVALRRLGDVPSRRCWVFPLRHSATSLGRIESCYDVATASSYRVGTVLEKLFCQAYLLQIKWMF